MIRGCQYVCALNPRVGTGEINPRTQRQFTALGVDFPNPTSLVTIYQTFLDGELDFVVCFDLRMLDRCPVVWNPVFDASLCVSSEKLRVWLLKNTHSSLSETGCFVRSDATTLVAASDSGSTLVSRAAFHHTWFLPACLLACLADIFTHLQAISSSSTLRFGRFPQLLSMRPSVCTHSWWYVCVCVPKAKVFCLPCRRHDNLTTFFAMSRVPCPAFACCSPTSIARCESSTMTSVSVTCRECFKAC